MRDGMGDIQWVQSVREHKWVKKNLCRKSEICLLYTKLFRYTCRISFESDHAAQCFFFLLTRFFFLHYLQNLSSTHIVLILTYNTIALTCLNGYFGGQSGVPLFIMLFPWWWSKHKLNPLLSVLSSLHFMQEYSALANNLCHNCFIKQQ